MDPDDLHELARVFLDHSPAMRRDLRDASAGGDLARVRYLVHRLAGTLGFFDARAAAQAGRLEAALVQGAPGDLASEVAALDDELQRVAARLHARMPAARTPSDGRL